MLAPEHQSTHRAADLFCGAGGLSAGLREAGFDVVAAADHDPDACATYRMNFGETALHDGDLTEESVHEAFVEDAIAEGPLDLLAGGPPCQGFSQMGNRTNRLIDDPRNRLYREFVRLLKELRPKALMMENVPGMSQLRGGAIRRQVEEDLSLEGDYTIASGVLDAGDFGTPQCRPRLIFLGLRADIGQPSLPEGTGVVASLRLARRNGLGYRVEDRGTLPGYLLLQRLLDPDDATAVTAGQALSDLLVPGGEYNGPPVSGFQRAVRARSDAPQQHAPSRIRDDTIRRLEAIPPGGNIYDLPADLRRRYLDGRKWGPAGDGEHLARRHYYAYRRLHPDWLAWTANTKADFAYHYAVPRGLSPRESARIQGFSDSFHFAVASPGTPRKLYGGDRHSLYRQVGNAVPPPLAAALGRALAGYLSVPAGRLTVAA